MNSNMIKKFLINTRKDFVWKNLKKEIFFSVENRNLLLKGDLLLLFNLGTFKPFVWKTT